MFKDEVILITGGTGSFGRYLSSHLLKQTQLKKLIVMSRDEWKQWKMAQDFENDNGRLEFKIGDVRDLPRLKRLFSGVDVVIHAAALKQVPGCEDNPIEAVKTNIMGAQNVIESAIDAKVKKVMALITDKSVRPINLYGATKLVSEKLFVHANSYSGSVTKFSCARWGNIVGTRGSVVPLFLEQKRSGVLTLTDPQMTRFFITLPQISGLFWKWLETMKGGEVFVPKSPSTVLLDLAKALAGKETKIKIVGKRIGEKVHEDLIAENEISRTYDVGKYYVIVPEFSWWNKNNLHTSKLIKGLDHVASNTTDHFLSVNEIRKELKALEKREKERTWH